MKYDTNLRGAKNEEARNKVSKFLQNKMEWDESPDIASTSGVFRGEELKDGQYQLSWGMMYQKHVRYYTLYKIYSNRKTASDAMRRIRSNFKFEE